MSKASRAAAIAIGDFVIINQFDRPCSRLVVVVRSISDEHVEGVYLCDDTQIVFPRGPLSNVYTIQEFGAEVNIFSDKYSVTAKGESVAEYSDGETRRWDDPEPGRIRTIRKEALETIEKAAIDMEDVKPCPFCGGAPRKDKVSGDSGWFTNCNSSCILFGRMAYVGGSHFPLAKWNCRIGSV